MFPAVCYVRNRERGTSPPPPPPLGCTSQRLCAIVAPRQRCVSLLAEGRAMERRGGPPPGHYAQLLVARSCARTTGLAAPRAHCCRALGRWWSGPEEVHWTTLLLPLPCGGGGGGGWWLGARAPFASQPPRSGAASSSAAGLDPYRPPPREEEPCHADWPTPPTPTAAGCCCFQRHARHGRGRGLDERR